MKVHCKANIYVKLAACKKEMGCPNQKQCKDGLVKYEMQTQDLGGKHCLKWYTRAVQHAGIFFGRERLIMMDKMVKRCVAK